MLPKPLACRGCPAYTTGIGYVPARGPRHTALAIIGQGPGAQEAASGRPFVGPSGQALSRWLRQAGIIESTVLIDNVVRCRLTVPGLTPFKDRAPTSAELAYCWPRHGLPRLRNALSPIPENRRCVVPCGVTAMTALLSQRGRATLAGMVFNITLPPGEEE